MSNYFTHLILIFIFWYCHPVSSGPPSYKYDFRKTETVAKNKASPGIYFDPTSGKFKRGNPPEELRLKSQILREEVKQQTSFRNLDLPFVKYTNNAGQASRKTPAYKVPSRYL
jgi:hypothetical protein